MKAILISFFVAGFFLGFSAKAEESDDSPTPGNIEVFNTERWMSYPDAGSGEAPEVPELLQGSQSPYQNLFSDDVTPKDLVPNDSWFNQYAEKKQSDDDDDDRVTNRFLDN